MSLLGKFWIYHLITWIDWHKASIDTHLSDRSRKIVQSFIFDKVDVICKTRSLATWFASFYWNYTTVSLLYRNSRYALRIHRVGSIWFSWVAQCWQILWKIKTISGWVRLSTKKKDWKFLKNWVSKTISKRRVSILCSNTASLLRHLMKRNNYLFILIRNPQI